MIDDLIDFALSEMMDQRTARIARYVLAVFIVAGGAVSAALLAVLVMQKL